MEMDFELSDNYENLYNDEEDAPKHEKLVDKVLRLDKTQHLKKPSRTEPSLQISEFNLVKSITGEKGSIQINDLTKSLKHKKTRVKISENVKRLQKRSHTLPKPLEKPQANRIRRTVAYEKARLELDRWEPTITANRVSTDLSFPLNNDLKMDKKESEQFAKMWRVKSDLEKELEKHEPKVEEYHIGLEEEKFPLTMKEMLARRKEAAKLRAYQGYKEAKARRQSKIKSKKYHRIQKRERIKQKLKEFELLQKTNPEEALKKLEEIEKSRIEERFSLRHKSTGKWARNQQIRAKYDKESRQILAQQLTLSRELTQKLKTNDSDSEEDEEKQVSSTVDENNPWVNGVKPGKEVADFLSGYRKFWMEKNEESGKKNEETDNENGTEEEKKKAEEINCSEDKMSHEKRLETNIKQKVDKVNGKKVDKSQKKKKKNKLNLSKSTSNWEVSFVEDGAAVEEILDKLENKLQKKMMQNVKKLKKSLIDKPLKKKKNQKTKIEKMKEKMKIDLTLPSQKKIPTIDDELITGVDEENDQTLVNLKNILSSEPKEKESNIDPEKYLKVKATTLKTAIPDILEQEEEDEEGEESSSQREIISEAFEDDDIIEDFDKEKQSEIDKNKPKNIDLSLPGWGSWGGANIKPNKRKKRRFIIKAPAKIPRRDDNKGSLIINENAQSKIKEHMVSEVPFPFKTVKDFEASMRAPIGNTFVPETAYKKLIKPVVTTKMGTIIEPISKDILLNKKT